MHELLHIHTYGALRAMELLMESRTEGWLHAAHKPFIEALEYGVDGIADGIAGRFPLPSEKH